MGSLDSTTLKYYYKKQIKGTTDFVQFNEDAIVNIIPHNLLGS